MTSSDTTPLDPPIPVPDVPGADATARGLPRRVDLTLRQRLIVDSSAVADIASAHRDRLAARGDDAADHSLGGLRAQPSRAPNTSSCGSTRELAAAKDPALSFPAPTAVPRVSSRPANPIAEWIAKGNVHNIRFNSSFEAVNPALREQCRGFTRNNVVHAQHWRHDDGPHPTLCVIHGFMGSPYLFNGLFFSLPWFYRSGYDVLLYTCRSTAAVPKRVRRSAVTDFSPNGFAGFAEAMAQAVHDFRSVIDYLEFTGVDRIALTGMSLGGYTSALIASVDDRIQAVIPNVPVVTPDQTVDEWFPANKVVALRNRLTSTDTELTERRDAVLLAAELSAAGAQGPPADHHRARRPAGAAGAGRDAVGALGSLRIPLVPRQPHPARQPAGLPAPDDPLHARLHVRLSQRRTHRPADAAPSSPAAAGCSGCRDDRRCRGSNAVSSGR